MAPFLIEPGVGIAPIRLGMSREEALAAMEVAGLSFKKTPSCKHPTDAYHRNGFQIFYMGDEPVVDFLELSRGCEFQVEFRGLSVFEIRAAELIERIAGEAPLDRSYPEPGYVFSFPTLGLRFWRPSIPRSNDDPEGRFFQTVGLGVPTLVS